MKHHASFTLALSLAACGGASTDLEGIWAIDAWNGNPTSCADPGADELANHDPYLFVMLDSLFGHSYLGVGECPDPATCATAGDEQSELFSSYFLDQGNDSKGWTGTISFSSGPDADNSCSGGVFRATLTVDAGGAAITIRDETIDVPSFPPRDGDCDPDDAAAAAESLPCTSLETVHATFSAAF